MALNSYTNITSDLSKKKTNKQTNVSIARETWLTSKRMRVGCRESQVQVWQRPTY